MQHFRQKILIILLLSVGLSLTSCYVPRLALQQNDLFNSRIPISEVKEPKLSAEKIAKLKLVKEVVVFAQQAHLNASGAYQYYIESPDDVVSYLVQAAYQDRFEQKKWWFPIVGSVPYRGYFEEGRRDQKAKELSEQGFDVYKTGVGAFSSLGWFDDPVFSSMLNRNKISLIHLIFHELVHRTVWIKGSVKFNENLAEYVADEITVTFLEHKGRIDQYESTEVKRADHLLFKKWLSALKKELEIIYKDEGLSSAQKIAKKELIIQANISNKPPFKKYDFIESIEWNNAAIMAISLYSPDIELFKRAQKCLKAKSAIEFMELLPARLKGSKNPFKKLASFCK